MHGRNRRCRGCDEMEFDYLYEERSESYSFYRIPKMLFTEGIFDKLSTEARVLYGLLLDRISLSRENGWVDEAGRVYVYYKIETVKKALRCANTKACGLLRELEEFGLVEKKKQGLGKPTLIYVKDFTRFRNAELLRSEMQNSGVPGKGIPNFRESECNKTEKNQTEKNKTHSIHSGDEARRAYTDFFERKLEVDLLKEEYPYDGDILEEIFGIIVDTVCSEKEKIRIAGEYKPANVVKGQLMKLESRHIGFVLDGLKENTVKVRCMKQYLLAALYNAPLTISNYYQALVNHDMATGKI